MGSAWSSWSSPSKPVIDTVKIDPADEVGLEAPLRLCVSFAEDTLGSVPSPPPSVVWTVTFEVDIAHLAKHHKMLATPACPFSREKILDIPQAAWEAVVAKHPEDVLANIGALHLKCAVGTDVVAEESLVVDVVLNSQSKLKRRLYGCLPSASTIDPDRTSPGYYPPASGRGRKSSELVGANG